MGVSREHRAELTVIVSTAAAAAAAVSCESLAERVPQTAVAIAIP